MNAQALIDTARTLIAGDEGLLAIDESNLTRNQRFAKLGIPQTEDARRAWRELIVTTPRLGESISGAILYDETIRQRQRRHSLRERPRRCGNHFRHQGGHR